MRKRKLVWCLLEDKENGIFHAAIPGIEGCQWYSDVSMEEAERIARQTARSYLRNDKPMKPGNIFDVIQSYQDDSRYKVETLEIDLDDPDEDLTLENDDE